MATYFIYDNENRFLGEVLAVDSECAAMLAQQLFKEFRILDHRLGIGFLEVSPTEGRR